MIKYLKHKRWYKIIKESTLFDAKYYLFTYPDIREQDIDPIEHYIRFGADEGRNPSAEFDTNFYFDVNPDVKEAGVNPLAHYILYGEKENRLTYQINNTKKIAKYESNNTILFVSHEANLTGAPIVLLELIKWFSINTLFELKLILLKGGPLYKEGVFQKYVDTLLINENFSSQQLKYFCPNANLIYGNTVVSSEVYERLDYLKAPIISHIHEQEGVLQTFPKHLKMMKKFTQYYIAASKAVEDNLINNHNIMPNKIQTVFSFIDNFANKNDIYKKAEYKKSLEFTNHDFLIVGCGTDSKSFHKGSDIFVEIANLIINKYQKNALFVWVGHIYNKEKQLIDRNIKKYNLENFIKFQGNMPRKYVKNLFKASDIFLLPSREDSFPLVALEAAQASTPIVCFDEAGDMPSFVQNDAGFVVPFLDIAKMAEKVNRLMDDDDLRLNYGKNAHNKVINGFSVEEKSLEIFSIVNKIINPNVEISVIIPNYNHAKYLDERIKSILNQSMGNIEIIILDDKSQDNSIDVIKKYITDKRVSVLINQTNSGSVFKQWIKGIERANSDIIWIAESDDKCENNFLELILEKFKDKNIQLVYSQSKIINGKNVIVAKDYTYYTDELSKTKWRKDYTNNLVQELEDGLAIKNTIPNASAVVFRKFNFEDYYEDIKDMTISGDWFFYLNCLKNGDIAFISKALNYHRRHPQSVVSKNEKNIKFINEIIKIQKHVLANYTLPMSVIKKMKTHINNEIDRLFDVKEAEENKKNLDYFPSLTIMLAISEFNYGGGEIFPIRLANALKKSGVNVIVLNIEHQPTHPDVINMLDKSIKVVSVKSWKNKKNELKNIVNKYDIDAIYSYVWWADKFMVNNIEDLNVLWGVCMCGCYENLTQSPNIDPDFNKLMPKIIQRVDKFLYLTKKNLVTFNKYPLPNKEKLIQVYIGYEPKYSIKPIDSKKLGISNESFVFGLIARAIPEKGWQSSIDLVIALRKKGYTCDLILCGESEYSKKLQLKYNKYKYIHFIGYVKETAEWIKIFDIGLLPSFFPSEALPNIIIEYLAYGKPVIGTNIGEIPQMIKSSKGNAGKIVGYDSVGEASLDEMLTFAIDVMDNKEQYKIYQQRAILAFKEKFSMTTCVDNYINITKNTK